MRTFRLLTNVTQLPYYTSWMNCLRCAFYAVHAWVAACLVVLMFTVNAERVDETATTSGVVYWSYDNYDTAKNVTNVGDPDCLTSLTKLSVASEMKLSVLPLIGERADHVVRHPAHVHPGWCHRFLPPRLLFQSWT